MTDVSGSFGDASMRDAVAAVAARVERAQQAEDVDAFVGLFHREAVWVTAEGKRLVGRDANAEFSASVLPGRMKHSTATYRAADSVPVRPDVALVSVYQTPVTLEGAPLIDKSPGKPTYVMVHDESRMVDHRGTEDARSRMMPSGFHRERRLLPERLRSATVNEGENRPGMRRRVRRVGILTRQRAGADGAAG